jgi:formylglycine-generating enzyme required for sulfatase activity
VLERIIADVYEQRFQEPPGGRSLDVLTKRLADQGHLPDRLDLVALSRRFSDTSAVRRGEKITPESVRQALEQLAEVLKWYIEAEQPGARRRPGAGVVNGPPGTTTTEPGPPPVEPKIAVIPKGLRSFDANDARFFLELLPGPRDEAGLPESVRFWKYRIEARDELTFTVGVIFGPSGCGKTSLIKAGLLPRLAKHVVSVYVESTAEETEARLLRGLSKKCPDMPGNLDLTGTIAALRQGQGLDDGQQLLIVLDQFEQWLHAKREEANTELAQALRQCDGERVRAIIMVRADADFWMEVDRFMRELHIELVQGQNSAAVALFEPRHAKKVLTAFGRAFGALADKLTRDEESFLEKSVHGLTENGRIVPVRLALFAEMVKEKPWSLSTFKEVGGAEGIGVLFLEEIFNSTTLKPHRKAAQAVLKALLPEEGSEIKGQKRAFSDLLAISGYRDRRQEFTDLLRMLNTEYRLVTPATYDSSSAESAEYDSVNAAAPSRFYQLTHDYLVPAVRMWLDRELRKTRRGHAERLIASRASTWKLGRDDHFLPTMREDLVLRILTRRGDWTEVQKEMMHRAGLVHLRRGAWVAVVLGVLGVAGLWIRGQQKAEALVHTLLNADIELVPETIDELAAYRLWAKPLLDKARHGAASERERLRAALALLPSDTRQLHYLRDRLLVYDPVSFSTVHKLLSAHRPALAEPLWQVLEDESSNPDARFQAACFLAESTKDATSAARWKKSAKFVAKRMGFKLGRDFSHFSQVVEALRPASGLLLDELEQMYRDPMLIDQHKLVTNILVQYFKTSPEIMADVLADANDPESFMDLFSKFPRDGRRSVELLTAQLGQPLPRFPTDAARDRNARHTANAAVALFQLDEPDEQLWGLLRQSPDPQVRSYLIHRLGPFGVGFEFLAGRLHSVQDHSILQALILALGEFPDAASSPAARESVAHSLETIYRQNPDPGVHGAARWLLYRWNRGDQLKLIDNDLARVGPDTSRGWYVDRDGMTMVVLRGPVNFVFGSPRDEPRREEGFNEGDERQHPVQIPRSFAIAAREVTLGEFSEKITEYKLDKTHITTLENGQVDTRCPANNVTWYQAAEYCNRLSERNGIDPSEWCYLPNQEGKYAAGMKPRDRYLSLKGYRLPTEAEWEYACRAGTITMRYYGQSDALLDKYAYYETNSMHGTGRPRLQPVGRLKPNDFGLFDMLGNAIEWCQDLYAQYPAKLRVDEPDAASVEDGQNRAARGEKFMSKPENIRAARRDTKHAVQKPDWIVGFRPARTLDPSHP